MRNIFLGLLLIFTQPGFAKIITYKAPPCNFISKDYYLKVREAGSPWQNVDIYHANVANVVDTKTIIKKTSFAYFDCSGTVEVNLTVNTGSIRSVKIRPLSLGIQPVIHGNNISFSISANQYMSIEVNGDIFQNMQLFANPLETTRPSARDTNVIYYGPGIHQIGKMLIKSNKTVYIAGGAIVEGSFIVDHAKNVHIGGRGILTQIESMPPTSTLNKTNKIRTGRNDQLIVSFSTNVDIDGIVFLPHKYTVLIGQSNQVKISNIKSFSSEGNADGIDIFCSADITLDHVFMRNSDDCIAIYGHRWNYYGNTKNVSVSNSLLWADVAHPILIGTHGDSQHPDTLSNMKFTGLEILDQHENQMDYQGCLSLNAGDSNTLRDISFENINIEQIRKGQLFNVRIMFNKKYNTSPGSAIENILFKNISYASQDPPLSLIAGYDEHRAVKNVVFENLQINGLIIADNMEGKPGFYKTGDMANIFIGEHVENIKFIKSPSK
ncbi:glycosyl hydrolase family 28 protein [Mucilaginibacter sp.]|jgi:hypothetical protein|uniref:glycosyl hydrolase family 28 protein n=1 Tax=Mucilaginibacter sp. TaxID=1882438 RepID=UPI0035617A61